MKDRIKLPLSFDPQRLQEDLASLEQTGWIDHFVQQNYEGSWSVIPLRAPADATHPVMMIYSDPTATEFADTPFLDGCPYFQEVLTAFQGAPEVARLMKLTAGSRIKEHTDLGLAFEDGVVRIHVPVVTNPDMEFNLNGERVVMNEGECWYLRLSDPHWLENRGSTDRVHMVIDAAVTPWMEKLFAQAEAG